MDGFSSKAWSLPPKTIWVSESGNDTSGDGSKVNPYKTINFAIGNISKNDTVSVIAGDYNENISIINKPDFVLKGETTASKPQIIGSANTPTITLNPGDSLSTLAMRIENLKITHTESANGSGLSIINSSLTLENCEIFNNQNSFGAGIYGENSTIEMYSNEFFNNDAANNNGGALALVNCFDVKINKNNFYANSADSGGAVFIRSNGLSGNSFFQDNIVSHNTASTDGGALNLKGNSVVWTFRSNSFAENQAGNNGGAGSIESSANVFFRKNIIVNNKADNNGGALAFANISSAINVWTNTITGNTALNNGGGLFFDNTIQVSVGGAANLSNNLFHNRDKTQLNNITSTTTITSLNLSQNYWGTTDQASVEQQLSIPLINTSWELFDSTASDVKIKLFAPQKNVWFADGKIEFNSGQLNPVGDSTLVIKTHPDTTFNIDEGIQSFLPKIYQFDWSNVSLSSSDARITFYLESSELDLLGRPLPESIQILENNASNWEAVDTETNNDGSEISASLSALNINLYTIGLDQSSLFLVDPTPNRADVDKDNPFKIFFQREMDEASLVKENIAVKGSFSGNIDFSPFFNSPSNTLYLTAQDKLQAGEIITVTLTDSIKTKSSGALENGFSWRFRTSAFRGKAQFQQAGIIQTRNGNNEYLFNDFDADQIPELIELSGTEVTVFKNINGSYSEENSFDSGVEYSKLRLADLNMDGINEIILFNNTSLFAYSYDLANGFTETFSKSYTNTGTLNDVLIEDFNNDRIPDISILLDLDEFRQIDCYYGELVSGYDFTTLTSIILNGTAHTFSGTDWNNDGLFDMVSSNGTDNTNIARIINQKTSFTSFFNTLPEIGSQTIISTANVLEDGTFKDAEEIIIAGTGGGQNLLKLFNIDEDGVLVEKDRRQFANPIESVYAADFNSDGFNDIAIGHSNNDITLLLSEKGVLQTQDIISVPILPKNILSIDYDADGDLDLLVYEQIDGFTSWVIYENESRSAKIWWVDGNAEDGDGSFANPFVSINQAITKSFSGDSILIHPGVFTEHISINHDLFVASQDTAPVVLKFDNEDIFSQTVLNVSGTQLFEAYNLTFEDDGIQSGTQALFAENNDSLVFEKIHIRHFEKAAQFNNNKGKLNAVFVEDNERGMQFNGSEMTLSQMEVQRNNVFGVASLSSDLSIINAEIRENGSNVSSNSTGLNLRNNSNVTLLETSLSENGNANILIDNSTINMQFTFVGEALSNGLNSDGNGVFATNGAILNIENSVLVDNYKIGLALENSQATILNSIIANNDSLFNQNGGGLFAKNNSIVDLRNSILLANNTAVSSDNSSIDINYNDFYVNNTALAGASLGSGNIADDPLMVFMYNPFGADGNVDGFNDLKLSPGSGLIDKGDPAIFNGETESRSDIGLFGNLALPQALSSIPQAAVEIRDSSVTLSWQQVAAEEEGLFKGTMIFRDSLDNFEPDTLNALSLIPLGTTSFEDNELNFGKEFYYRFAFVDTNGASNAYSPVLQGRIDFKEIRSSLSLLSVQLGQGDTLTRPVTLLNNGTVPVTVSIKGNLPDWLTVFPKQLQLDRNSNDVFVFRFDAASLVKDSLYNSKLDFVVQEDTTVHTSMDVQMLVSYRDLRAPQTTLFKSYPDTVRQANLTFAFEANDTAFSTIGTPQNLMRYIYRFAKIDDAQPTVIESDTTNEQRLDFYPLENGRYLFQVAALDTAGNGALGDNSSSVSVNVKSGEIDIMDGYWQMVALPRKILGSGVEINAPNLKALRHWQDERYQFITPDSILAGLGYWVFSTSIIHVDLQQYEMIDANNNFVVKLQNGWNMIGNPWSWNISFDEITFSTNSGTSFTFEQAVSDGLINSGIYYWNASNISRGYRHETSSKMSINTGYWLKTNQELSVHYNPKPFVLLETSLPKTSSILSKNEQDAVIRLKVKQGRSADTDNYFGLAVDKKEYPYFYQSALEPPAIYDNIRLFSKETKGLFTSGLEDFNSVDSSQVWDLIVEGSNKEEIVLSWENVGSSSEIHFYLYHLESGEWFNLKERDSFKIENNKTQNHLKLIASEDENFTPQILPVKYALSQNYPNPFNPVTTIKLSVPFFADGVQAKLDVFDVLGRKVKNLLNKKVKSGEIEVSWHGENSLGKQVASGIYFYRVSAGDFTTSKKMILIR